MKKIILIISIVALGVFGCKSAKYADLGDGIYADIQTTEGDIVVKLYHKATPVTVANFVSLAEGTNDFVTDSLKEKKYYDGLTFHRVMKDFMIQGGDPLGNGSGNPGYRFADEIVDSLKHDRKGILSMANAGPKTNGSQFFITHKETPWLNGKHTVFGEVVYGLEVVDSIAAVKVGPGNKPDVDVIMNNVDIIRNGKEAKKFDANSVLANYFEEAERMEAVFKKMKEETVAEFKQQSESVEALPSGLKIVSLKTGEGEQPKHGQKVYVNYAGWLMANADLFDTSDLEVAEKFEKVNPGKRDQGGYTPYPMDYSPDAALAPGFREGLLTMKVGDKIRIFVPPYLGYGDNDYGPIPGGSTLVFDLEVTGIAQ
ncbi:peptidylprolyl isomerase [Croceivirga thetidis]|uniref:peptidylprolyl isomerase n=1 Tax=Croceivirga thetidis TaxID=2721623 RepID=A0ABX1GT94_9FLAO|nr:peptidylprolyl isomerase [Croceivirga thetidis]NKI32834.1 peptidylprolyl isomerase [Croceivirga thetidis]